jgi:hypothetical protein
MTEEKQGSGPVAANVQADTSKESGQRVESMQKMKVDVGGGGEQMSGDDTKVLFEVEDLNCYYGSFRAVRSLPSSARRAVASRRCCAGSTA